MNKIEPPAGRGCHSEGIGSLLSERVLLERVPLERAPPRLARAQGQLGVSRLVWRVGASPARVES